ncbi:OLC1v1023434C1 [Oldenlandia corymbosa var. corymbosa]|uniref:Ubiquitin carboxyl-terminal hydrolase n=1 Tax=Oldenlandia corymbosa var. corymbosa TaxID=529605 RepID=A0AAV1C2D5_OLDCO|nr:OLC1v1023434C1 [Oldenlandia corymbosa var. corymbosa]
MAVLQMTWQPSSLSQKRKSGPPLGLRNLGNTCYLNSVLQCLTYTPPLANFCLKSQHSSSCDIAAAAASEKKRECPFCILEKRILRSLMSESNLDAPLKMNNCLKIFAEHFRHGRQEDAHEFLRYVIDACHNTCLRLKKLQLRRKGGDSGYEGTIVKEIFGGALQSQVKCLSCGAESNKVDEIMDISLDILHSGSLKESLQRFFQHEILDGSNKYRCDHCKKLVAARKQMSILQAPNVLVIQLKRFEGILGGKIDKAIAFEEVLVLSSYMCKGSQDLCPEYRLCGTIVHSGFSPDSGHYFAYIKDAFGRWYCCNDSCVRLSNVEEVLSEKVYILFFTRSKQRPPLMKTRLLANGSKSHHSNGSDASETSSSCVTEEVMSSTKHLSDLGRENINSNVSKVESGASDPSIKLGVFDGSSPKKNHANGGIKIIVHRKDPNQKTCNQTDVRGENRGQNVRTLSNGNGIHNIRADYTSGTLKPLYIKANGTSKIENGNGHVVDAVHEVDGEAKVENNHADSVVGHKQTNLQILSNGSGVRDVRPNGTFHSLKGKLPLVTTGGYRDIHVNGHSSDGDGCSNGKGNFANGKVSLGMDLSDGNVRCNSDGVTLKRKLQDRESCILLSKDAQSSTEVEKFKEVLKKEASLFLVSCGWSDEVYKFMQSHKKRSRTESDTSDFTDLKRLLIKDAGMNFTSKVPQSLKRKLIEDINVFSKERQSPSVSRAT